MAYHLTEDHPETYLPTTKSTKEKIVKAPCPSHPLVRQRHLEYFVEMVDALPEADGLFLETRDEYYGCTCETCNRVIDDNAREAKKAK